MKLGFSEILFLLLIIGVVLFVIRGNPLAKTAQPRQKPIVRQPTADELEEQRIKDSRKKRLRWAGGAFLIVGIIILAGTLKMFPLLFSWYGLAALILIAGIVAIVLSARR